MSPAGEDGDGIPRPGDRAEYLVYRLATGLLALLPERLAETIGGLLGVVAGRVLRLRWKDTLRHLEIAFPERDGAWRREIATASYRHLGREGVATLLLSRESAGRIRERTRVEGLEALERALHDGEGALLLAGHLGNWEIGGAALAVRGIPLDAVAFEQKNPLFDRDLVEARSRLGMRVVVKQDAAREVLRSVRQGRVAALVADQNIRRRGVWVDFFGVPAATARGPAVLALRSGAPVFLGTAVRERAWPPLYDVRIEPVEMPEAGDPEADVRALTQAFVSRLEARVREHPGQYFWQHRRWKTRPPDEDPAPSRPPIPGAHVAEG